MTAIEKQMIDAISEVLHYVWDPIDIHGIPQARDEYEGYVGPLFTMLSTGATEEQIAKYLETIADQRMGLPNRKERSKEAASVILDWHDHLFGVDA